MVFVMGSCLTLFDRTITNNSDISLEYLRDHFIFPQDNTRFNFDTRVSYYVILLI